MLPPRKVLWCTAMSADRFVALQREHHRRADEAHFLWQTRGPWFARTEAELVAGVRVAPGERLLEIGCGEGGNLHHVAARSPGARLYGVDFSPAKAAFAQRSTGVPCLVADAARLPFVDASFDALLVRDLLHHVPDRSGALAEARRVLKPGGRLTLIEPNRRSPLVLLQAAAMPAERGLFASSRERILDELTRAGFTVEREEARQPLPLARVLLHPRAGAGELGAVPAVARALASFERLAERLVPRRAWLYLLFEATRHD